MAYSVRKLTRSASKVSPSKLVEKTQGCQKEIKREKLEGLLTEVYRVRKDYKATSTHYW